MTTDEDIGESIGGAKFALLGDGVLGHLLFAVSPCSFLLSLLKYLSADDTLVIVLDVNLRKFTVVLFHLFRDGIGNDAFGE